MKTVLPLLLCLASPAFAGQVRVVGPLPAPYANIQDAITASSDGDVILVKSGTYTSIRVQGKTLSIVADVGAMVNAVGAARISTLSPSQAVLLSGIKCTGADPTNLADYGRGLSAVNNSGPILAQTCTFNGFVGAPGGCGSGDVPSGVHLEGSSGSFVDCVIRGGVYTAFGTYWQPRQGDALLVMSNARIACDQTQAFGGEGGVRCGVGDEASGGNGATFFDASATEGFFAGCTLRGGFGNTMTPPCSMGLLSQGCGGSGILSWYSIPNRVRLLATSTVGGFGGGYVMQCSPGPGAQPCDGSPVVGQAITIPGTVRTVRGPRVVRDSQAVTLTFTGAPGEMVEMVVANNGLIHQYDTAQNGVLHVASMHWRPIGTVPAGGVLTTTFKLPKLRPTDPGFTWFTQARFRNVSSNVTRLANAWAIVEIDSTY